jgi:uncharacterized repeat protein (TIGR03803 family)
MKSLSRALLALSSFLILVCVARAQTFTVLYNFTEQSGASPYASVIEDSAGNLYGTTQDGGSSEYGVVYEVSSSGTETLLYSFTGSTDGGNPYAPVIRDSKGNLYGTTKYGGNTNCSEYGCGVAFKLDTAGKETVLHSFTGRSDGWNPLQGLIMDKKGKLYGTTYYGGGAYNEGMVFKLTAKGTETILHSFEGGSSDGAYPEYGHLLMGKAGDLYGLTWEGGGTGCYYSYGCGVLYRLTVKGKFTVLHSFAGGSSDGCYPYGSVAMDKAGDLYGTTFGCGSENYGTVWKVSNKGKETILHNFAGGPSDGAGPLAGVVLDSKGNIYGVAEEGGADSDGAVYELSPKGTLTVLHSFDYSDGAYPFGELLRTAKGELFGTTYMGGTDSAGVVWSYMP